MGLEGGERSRIRLGRGSNGGGNCRNPTGAP